MAGWDQEPNKALEGAMGVAGEGENAGAVSLSVTPNIAVLPELYSLSRRVGWET